MSPSGSPLAGIWAVDVPVPQPTRQPRVVVLPWPEAEPADHTLAAVVIAVQDVDDQPFSRGDALGHDIPQRIGSLADRALPEPVVTGRDVDVARETSERLDVGTL